MLVLPTTLFALSSISGAGGLALSAKSVVDSFEAEAVNRAAQEQNDRNILRLKAASEQLDEALEELGKQRMIISKNFSAFVKSFEQIHNRPQFTKGEDAEVPPFDFDEIQNISIVATQLLGASVGVIGGSVMAAVASSGAISAVMALGAASTGTKIATLHGAAAVKATLAALGGGALSAGGGGIALGTLVLNAASLGVGALVEGIAIAYAGSISKKKADERKEEILKQEVVINDAIKMQLDITHSINALKRVSVDICNTVYKPLVLEMKNLVARKTDWNTYTVEEKTLIENNILIVQILHYLNNTAVYKVIKENEKGEVEEVAPNTVEVNKAIKYANKNAGRLKK